jgi:hypothetical protein
VRRRYRPGTLVLETEFQTETSLALFARFPRGGLVLPIKNPFDRLSKHHQALMSCSCKAALIVKPVIHGLHDFEFLKQHSNRVGKTPNSIITSAIDRRPNIGPDCLDLLGVEGTAPRWHLVLPIEHHADEPISG